MKPNRLRYVATHGFMFSTCASALSFATVIGWQLLAAASYTVDLSFAGWFLLSLIISLPLGWFFGAFCVWPFVFGVVGTLNGAPFHVGESVRVLVGPHRDQVFEIYDIWYERHQVRVKIGKQEQKQTIDVFSYDQVCRERKDQQGTSADGREGERLSHEHGHR